MLKSLEIIFFIQLYWLSLLFIGFGLIYLLSHSRKKIPYLTQLSSYIIQFPFLVRLFFSFVVSVSFFSVISIIMYSFMLPAFLFTIVYIALLVVIIGCLSCVFIRDKLYKKTVSLTLSLDQSRKTYLLWLGIVVTVLIMVVDYVISLKFGGTIYNQNDVGVHLTRIITIIQEGFSFNDGLLKNVIESRYHLNVIYALYVPPSQLLSQLGVLPADVWRWSLPFFRMLQWLAVFSLSFVIFKYWLDQKTRDALTWSFWSVPFAIPLYAGLRFVADYPNHIAILWIVAYIIGLILFTRRKSFGLMIILASLLLAMTHPTYSIMVLMFVALYYIFSLLFNFRIAKESKFWVVYAVSSAILASTPLLTKLYPNYVSKFAAENGVNIKYASYLPISPLSHLRYPLLLMGLFAILYIIIFILRKNRNNLLAALSITLFVPIIVFNPMAISIISRFITNNMFSRFSVINVLYLIILPLFLFAFFDFSKRIIDSLISNKKTKKLLMVIFYLGGVLLVFYVCLITVKPAYSTFKLESSYGGSEQYAKIHRVHDDLSGVINNRAMVIADMDESYFLPLSVSAYVLAIHPSHSAATAAIYDRVDCQSEILENFKQEDLLAVGADFVVLPVSARTPHSRVEVAEKLPYLEKITQTQDYVVFKFIETYPKTESEPTKSCIDYRNTEQGL